MRDDYNAFEAASEDGMADSQVAALEQDLEKLKDSFREERFCWALAILILLDVIFFTRIDGGWGAPITILFLEVILLLVLARKWGVEDLTDVIDKIVKSPFYPSSKDRS